jgi:hypothetical protein
MIPKAIAIPLLALTLCVVSTANAQSYSTITPTYGGGYSVWNSDGSYSTITPTYGGGYQVWNSNSSYSTLTPTYGGGYQVWNSNRSNRSYGGFDPGIAASYTGPQYLYNGLTALGNGIAEGISRYQEQKRQQAFYDMMLLHAQIAAKREVQRQADQMRAQQVRSATSTAASMPNHVPIETIVEDIQRRYRAGEITREQALGYFRTLGHPEITINDSSSIDSSGLPHQSAHRQKKQGADIFDEIVAERQKNQQRSIVEETPSSALSPMPKAKPVQP